MGWYDDKKVKVHAEFYKSEGDYKKDVQRAGKHGWHVESAAIGQGKVKVGSTVAKGVLTGGLGILLTGRSRKQLIAVTWRRD